VGIIRKAAPKPGWRSTVEIPRRVLTCETCGALCDEATTDDHDAWHYALDRRSLPELVDFLTSGQDVARPSKPANEQAKSTGPTGPTGSIDEADEADDSTDSEESEQSESQPNPVRRHIYLPRLIAADELRRQDPFGQADESSDELQLADGTGG
jgi:hypothetical protein